MLAVLVLVSAFLHALWNALLKAQKDRLVAGVVVIAIAEVSSCAVMALSLLRPAPLFPASADLAWAAAAGVFEAAYFVLLVRALAKAPLGVVYSVSRGGAIAFVFPISVLVLGERVTGVMLLGALVLVVGLVATAGARSARAPLGAWGAAASIAGYHLCYKQALAHGAVPAAVFSLAMAIALPVNVATLGKGGISRIARTIRAQPLHLAGCGVGCAASFLLLLYALAQGGAGMVLAIRNTSIVFATLLGRVAGERVTKRDFASACVVMLGVILVTVK